MTKQLMAEVDVGRYMFVDQQAKKRKISKRMFLEHMIDVYKDMIESRDLDLAYENMGRDEEYLLEMKNNSSLLGTL